MYRLSRDPFFTESAVVRHFRYKLRESEKIEIERRFLSSPEEAQTEMQRLTALIAEKKDREARLLEQVPSLKEIFAAIERGLRPPRAITNIWSDPTGYSRGETEWYLSKDKFSEEEIEVFYGIAELLRNRARAEAERAFIRGKAIVKGFLLPSTGEELVDTQSTKGNPLPTTSNEITDRRALVDAYLDEVLKKKGLRITRTDIWKKAGYKSRTEFERWERNDPQRQNKSASERFTQILGEKPHLK